MAGTFSVISFLALLFFLLTELWFAAFFPQRSLLYIYVEMLCFFPKRQCSASKRKTKQTNKHISKCHGDFVLLFAFFDLSISTIICDLVLLPITFVLFASFCHCSNSIVEHTDLWNAVSWNLSVVSALSDSFIVGISWEKKTSRIIIQDFVSYWCKYGNKMTTWHHLYVCRSLINSASCCFGNVMSLQKSFKHDCVYFGSTFDSPYISIYH